ncbi:hypothetical protein cypCar_00007974 [Cyprinus carpio]|nr:hypothetical protein cypCar_00007974 [Cyprinus carpio]
MVMIYIWIGMAEDLFCSGVCESGSMQCTSNEATGSTLTSSLMDILLQEGKVCGLCGNFDGNQNNDLLSSSNQMEVDAADFGNS